MVDVDVEFFSGVLTGTEDDDSFVSREQGAFNLAIDLRGGTSQTIVPTQLARRFCERCGETTWYGSKTAGQSDSKSEGPSIPFALPSVSDLPIAK